MEALRHSVVPPSGVASRARGTQIVTAPNVPIRVRSRWPWRWPDTGERAASALGSVSGALLRSTLAVKRSLQLGFEQFLDEGADAGAHPPPPTDQTSPRREKAPSQPPPRPGM